MVDLTLVPTEQLMMEMFSRYDSAVFAGHKVLADKGSRGSLKQRYRRWNGDRSVCSGLCFEVSLCCATDQLNGEKPGMDD